MTTLSGPERTDLFKDELLHDIFIQTARRFPDKVALRWQNDEIMYSQLYQRASHLALILQQTKNIRTNDRVGIWLSRSAQLHVTILAVLMTGATYVPFDADVPQERVNEILDDLQIVVLLIDSRISIRHPLAFNVQHLHEDLYINGSIAQIRTDIHRNLPAYIICTSGSTGKPKAIAISHRSICHFVRADNEIMQIRYEDIVYQGSSAAFDMFLEETFLSYSVGATLVIPSKMDILNSDKLHQFFIHHSITVLFCVPTLLLLMHNDPALKLRLINTGGEACPQTLVDRWWKEDRLIFNSYGPTEITVAATVQSLRPGQPISIGVPLPNYVCCLLDEMTGQPTFENTGELCIHGPGVALGYINHQSLTKEKFTKYGYRTGDRVSIQNGQIFFHERIDSQVKLRGYRMELDEIEQELVRLEDKVVSAVVTVLNEQLIAFVVGHLNESQMREELRQRLPSYMVPDRLVTIDGAMPRLSSGKIDRKAIAALLLKDDIDKSKSTIIELDSVRNNFNEQNDNRQPLDVILSVFQKSFVHQQPKANDDFFIDLGGHSLIATLTITELRKWFHGIALHDLYECRTATKLAERLTNLLNEKKDVKSLKLSIHFVKPSYTRIILCSLYQALIILILSGIASLEFILPYIIFILFLREDNIGYACLAAYGIFVIVPVFRHILSLTAKWFLIGRYEEGDFPLWGWMYVRWWTVERLRTLAMPSTLADSPLMSIYYRLFGAKIGRNVHLGSINCEAPDLLEINDETTISSEVHFQTAFVEDYTLKFRRIYIGKNSYIGSRSVISGRTKMNEYSELHDFSFLPPNTCVPEHEVWHGSPAIYSHHADLTAPLLPNNSMHMKFTSIGSTIIFAIITLLFMPLFHFIPIIPGLLLFEYIDIKSIDNTLEVFIFCPCVGILYTCLVIIQIIIIRYLITRKLEVGVYSTKSLIYIQKWLFDRVLEAALHVMHTFYATLYMVPFLRVLGMKIGRHCEVSTAIGMIYSLIEIDDECFIADNVLLCEPYIRYEQIHLEKTTLGKRVFIGNSAIIPNGKHIPNECLIGCMSLLADELLEKQSCLGSPAFILPNREHAPAGTLEISTYRPSTGMIVQRLCIDTIRIFLPRTIIVLEIGLATEIFDHFNQLINFSYCLLTLPILYIGILALPSLLFCILLKWILMRKYRTNHYPLWSWFVWISDFITVTFEQLTVPLILDFLQGTYFIAPALRCFGVKIGQHCFVNSIQITEFDLINIGDQVVINTGAELQTHLFEDRVMKLGEIHVENQTNIGCLSTMLPNTRLGSSSKLGPLSLVIKGENIPPNTSWQGIPIREYN
ncbi:hypothetical protein I4U23_003873 [Adineta vaga]|nr:hypothetical protein I4U23_003873 [Adineta vaga]